MPPIKISQLNKTDAVQSADLGVIVQDGTTFNFNPSTVSTDWKELPVTPTLTSSEGQRQYEITLSDVDYTGILGAGTRLRIARTVTPPTQSMSFVATSSQYASKSSPAGIAFTDDFTCEAWVYLDSYPTAQAGIISMANGSSGWHFKINTEGQVMLFGHNSGLGNYSGITSYQSLPIKKWVHIAAALDMSAYSATSSLVYIDGVSVPGVVSRAGTNPVSLVQAGSLQMGAFNSAGFFNGKIAKARVWSTIRTSTEIRNNMNIQLVGNETGLAFCSEDDGTFGDSTINNNTLTPVNGAIATYADYPSRPLEYAIVTSTPIYTSGDTIFKVFCPEGTGIPNETLGAISYSTARAPYGFPTARNKWSVSSLQLGVYSLGVASNATHYITPAKITVPTGEWMVGCQGGYRYGGSSPSVAIASFALLTVNTANFTTGTPIAEADISTASYVWAAGGVNQGRAVLSRSVPRSVASPTVYSLAIRVSEASGAYEFAYGSVDTMITLTAECTYL